MQKGLVFALCTMALLSSLLLPAAASAMPTGPTAMAGFSDMPLRNCEGTTCGELAKMPIGTQVNILLNDREGWAYVQVPSLNMYGWANTHHLFNSVCKW